MNSSSRQVETRLQSLGELSESELREDLLLPLLNRLGFRAPIIYHGPRERGKDVVCWDYDRLGRRRFLAVVAKTIDLSGDVSTSRGLREVVYQTEQCFNVPYHDLFQMQSITMDQAWIVTTGRLVPGAAESVMEFLSRQNLAKLVTIVPGEELLRLTDEHFPAFWSGRTEPSEVLLEQRDRIAAYLRRVLEQMGGTPEDVRSLLTQLLHGKRYPEVSMNRGYRLLGISPYNVDLSEASSVFAHSLFTPRCGLITEHYLKTRQCVYSAMGEIEGVVFNYEQVAQKTEPEAFCDGFGKYLASEYPFWRATSGAASDAAVAVQMLREGLADLKFFTDVAREQGRLDWVLSICDSLLTYGSEVGRFIASHSGEDLDIWWTVEGTADDARVSPNFSEPSSREEVLFQTRHTVEVRDRYDHVSGRWMTRPLTSKDVLEDAAAKLRACLDSELGIEHE